MNSSGVRLFCHMVLGYSATWCPVILPWCPVILPWCPVILPWCQVILPWCQVILPWCQVILPWCQVILPWCLHFNKTCVLTGANFIELLILKQTKLLTKNICLVDFFGYQPNCHTNCMHFSW